MNDWIKINLKIEARHLENLSASFFAQGIEGLQEQDNSVDLYFSSRVWNSDKLLSLLQAVREEVPDFDSNSILISEQPTEDWNENWKMNFQPLHLKNGIVVVPDWENYPARPDEQVIRISPKMAFGTGHHETTQLILENIGRYLTPGMAVLDAGTGSGILAVYAALSGAAEIVAFDNDPVAIENARENCLLNGVEKKVQLQTGVLSGLDRRSFDLITANINRNVLLELAADWIHFSHKQSVLLLSGLLQGDRKVVGQMYRDNGWTICDEQTQGEWLFLAMRSGESV